MVRNSTVEVEEIPLSTLEDYERSYEEIELLVSSNRMDTVVSSLCKCKRSDISNKIQKREIMINYDFLKDSSYKLKADLSRQFVRNSKELIRHNIYPLDYKLNNLMCENGELRIIDLDDFHTKVCRIPNPILS